LTSSDQRAARFIILDGDLNLVLAIQNAPYPRKLYRRLIDALQLARVIDDTAICFGAVVDSPADMAVLADFIARCEGFRNTPAPNSTACWPVSRGITCNLQVVPAIYSQGQGVSPGIKLNGEYYETTIDNPWESL